MFEERRFAGAQKMKDEGVGYLQWTNKEPQYEDTMLYQWNVARRKAVEFHKIYRLHSKKVFTLFFVGKRRREWGYATETGWVDHKTYRKTKNGK